MAQSNHDSLYLVSLYSVRFHLFDTIRIVFHKKGGISLEKEQCVSMLPSNPPTPL
ncbi:hypothetical protein KSU1_D0893 [Candidatus Jettenia caeni]|uniref:Uncharacterized protein n=1 Tax=Candidatus Jettenia caeni TaxID=247490 RepID=I3IR57_9BACT|nr:hypothetical protein KSU1_D0893 [Candidatus Jettenia caeni]